MNSIKLLLILLCAAAGVNAQQGIQQPKTYYKNSAGKFISEREMDSTFLSVKKKMSNFGMIPYKEFKNKIEKPDSIIYEFTMIILDSASLVSYIKDKEHKEKLIGQPLPSFNLKDINGKTLTLEQFKGKAIVINLWFTACPPCVLEMPELNRIKELPEYSKINFIAITFDTKEKVQNFLTKKDFNFIHLVDAQSYCELFTSDYPVNIFVDKNGIVTDIAGGMPLIAEKNKKTDLENSKVDPTGFIRSLNKIK